MKLEEEVQEIKAQERLKSLESDSKAGQQLLNFESSNKLKAQERFEL